MEALSAVRSTAERTLYVGDSEVDVADCQKCRASTFVGVTWGFRGRETLMLAGAKRVVDAPEELLDIL